jgi:hypothetical protein
VPSAKPRFGRGVLSKISTGFQAVQRAQMKKVFLKTPSLALRV